MTLYSWGTMGFPVSQPRVVHKEARLHSWCVRGPTQPLPPRRSLCDGGREGGGSFLLLLSHGVSFHQLCTLWYPTGDG